MRELTDHVVEGDSVNHQLVIEVMDQPGAGGAYHEYEIRKPDSAICCRVSFQNGPIKEAGVNGVTQEALLAIVIDRLRAFQAGPFACDTNAAALTHCQLALQELQMRTRERMARGVEGTHQK